MRQKIHDFMLANICNIPIGKEEICFSFLTNELLLIYLSHTLMREIWFFSTGELKT